MTGGIRRFIWAKRSNQLRGYKNKMKMKLRYAPMISLVTSIGLLAFGLWSGEASALWHKAVTICLSCVGIG